MTSHQPGAQPRVSRKPWDRIWLHGFASGTSPHPVRRLAADIAGRAAQRKVRLCGGWEFADGTLIDPDDPIGLPTPVMVGGTVARWDSSSAGQIRAAVMLRDLPRPRIGWDGSDMRCEWAVVAEAERRWSHQVVSPLLWLGVAGGELTDQLGDASPLVKLALQSPTPLPAAQIMPVNALPPDRLEDLLARITAPDRAEGLLITTVEQAGVLTGAMLAAETVALWPGLVSLVMVEEEGRQRLAEHLPERCIPPSGARWFAPATDSIGDQTLRRRQMARPEVLARLVDRALSTRASTAPAGLAAEAAALLTPDRRLVVPTAPDQLELLRDRNATLAKELAQTRSLLQQRSAELDRKEQLLSAAHKRARRTEKDLAAAELLITQHDGVIEDLKRRLDAAHTEADRHAAAAEVAEQELAEAVRARARLAGLVVRNEERRSLDDFIDQPLPADFGALLRAARERFTLLDLDAVAEDVARTLDQHPQAATWRRRTWDALQTLQSYAYVRSQGQPVGDLITYCRSGAPGVVIAASIIAAGEHEGVKADDRFRRARTFPVAPATDPSGAAFFGAHIRLGSGRPPAPRLHFLDDTHRTRRVYVGYIGPHLPNRRTN